MPLIEVCSVRLLGSAVPGEAWALDRPVAGELFDGSLLEIRGWIVRGRGVRRIEVSTPGRSPADAAVNGVRQDIAVRFPDLPQAARSGFRVEIPVVAWSESALSVTAVTDDAGDIEVAEIVVRRRWREDVARETPPMVSIVVVSDGDPNAVAGTIESALSQTYPHVEIVVAGVPSDGLHAHVDRYSSVRIVGVDAAGAAGARNTAIRRTTGDFLLFIDAGQRLLPTAIDMGLQRFREHPEAAAVLGHRRGAEAGSGTATAAAACEPEVCVVLLRRSAFDVAGQFDDATPEPEAMLVRRLARYFPVHCSHILMAETLPDSRVL
jgi:hypothetical protein